MSGFFGQGATYSLALYGVSLNQALTREFSYESIADIRVIRAQRLRVRTLRVPFVCWRGTCQSGSEGNGDDGAGEFHGDQILRDRVEERELKNAG